MSVAERIRCCRLIEKMEQNVEYAEKLGVKVAFENTEGIFRG